MQARGLVRLIAGTAGAFALALAPVLAPGAQAQWRGDWSGPRGAGPGPGRWNGARWNGGGRPDAGYARGWEGRGGYGRREVGGYGDRGSPFTPAPPAPLQRPNQAWRRGQVLPGPYRDARVPDPGRYHLRNAPNGFDWVGDGRDAYLMQRSTGLVLDSVPEAYAPPRRGGRPRR